MNYQVKEIWCKNQNKKIYGLAYIPTREASSIANEASSSKYPLVIFSHELGSSHKVGKKYADHFASQGIAYYVFDYCGGSADSFGNKSDGDSLDMSLRSEYSDLTAVYETASKWDFVDPDRIYLHGGSQGGLLSGIFAARHKETIAGLIMLYPALSIRNYARSHFDSKEDIPEKFWYIDLIWVGKNYILDAWNLDVESELSPYEGPILLMHGDADPVVKCIESDKASKYLKNCEYHRISGGLHGFKGQALEDAYRYMEGYFRAQNVL